MTVADSSRCSSRYGYVSPEKPASVKVGLSQDSCSNWHFRMRRIARCLKRPTSLCYWHRHERQVCEQDSSASFVAQDCRSFLVHLWTGSLERRWEVGRYISWEWPSGSSRMLPNPTRRSCSVFCRQNYYLMRMGNSENMDCEWGNAGW